jgi:hypothetical protein
MNSRTVRLPPPFQLPVQSWPAVTRDVITENLLAKSEGLEANSPLPVPNLTAQVHPNFDFSLDRWCLGHAQHRAAFVAAYDLGLRLASTILESDRVVKWIGDIVFASMKERPSQNPNNRPDLYLEAKTWTRRSAQETRWFLRSIVPHWWKIKIRPVSRSVQGEVTRGVYASVSDTGTFQVSSDNNVDCLSHRQGYGLDVGFNHGFIEYAVRVSHMSVRDKADPAFMALDQRTQLLFAFVLLHEFIHIIESLITTSCISPIGATNPQFRIVSPSSVVYPHHYCIHLRQDAGSNEWGGVFEAEIFGIAIHPEPQNPNYPAPGPFRWYPTPIFGLYGSEPVTSVNQDGEYEHGPGSRQLLAPMQYVNWWFQEDNLHESIFFIPWTNNPDAHLLKSYWCTSVRPLANHPFFKLHTILNNAGTFQWSEQA